MWITKGAEPFFFPSGPIACLLVHGFTSSPREMRGLGKFLAENGYTSLGIRLFAHATRFQDMPRARWQDWLADVESGWHLLDGNHRRVVVIGFSLGGSLSLLFSAFFPVEAVIAIAAPHHLPRDPRLPFLKPLSLFKPYLYPSRPPVWYDDTERINHIRYPNDSTRTLAEVHALLQNLQTALPKVTAPLFLIYSQNDPTIRAEEHHMENIYAQVSSSIKETLTIENSGHIIPLDSERDRVNHAIVNFIHRVVQRS